MSWLNSVNKLQAQKSDITHNHTVDGLSNVTTTAKAINDIFQWNGTAWVNKTLAASGLQPALGYTAENVENKGVANGYASLDGAGKLPAAQMPASLVGAVVYQGTWNANTNTPALASGTGTKGFYYKVSVAGATAIDGHSAWAVGDTLIFDGTTWDAIDGTDTEVLSVFGRTGAVTLLTADITTALGYTPYNSSNPAGYLSANQAITVSGDATGSGATAVALTLAASGVAAGTYNNSATAVTPFTVDAKGRVTAVGAAVTQTPAWGSVSGKPTTYGGLGITNVGMPYDQCFTVFSVCADAETVYRVRAPRAFAIPATGHTVQAAVAATGSTVFTVAKNGTSIGTFTFAAAGTVPTAAITATSFAIGDVLTVTCQATADATLADIDFSLLATLA